MPTREATHGVAAAPPPPEQPTHVVIVTLDGARPREIFEGVDPELARAQGLPEAAVVAAHTLLPNLSELMGAGAVFGSAADGAPMQASGPNFVSLPGYTELMTGRGPSSCADNGCRWVGEHTLVDDLTRARGCRSERAAVVSSWPDIGRVVALRAECATVSSGRHGGSNRERFEASPRLARALERGEKVDPFPGVGDFRPDRLTAPLAIGYLEEHAPDFLFLALGETDEYAHRGDYRGYLAALREADRSIGELRRVLATLEAKGHRTALFVTADHGRARSFRDHGERYPESASIWLVAAGSAITRPAAPSRRAHRLADVAPTVRRLLGLADDRSERAGEPFSELVGARLATR